MLLKLILENYIPLLSSNIKKVELNTEHMINLFISASGSGKSSILKELNPLPPENCNYEEGGHKYSEWKVGPNHYVLDSYTGQGNGHSFKVNNGPELNTGGTYSAQKELAESHFGIDLPTAKVLAGVRVWDRLSLMTPSRRKDVLMSIYPNDTNYAMGVFNKLKIERNELKAAIKNQIGRYAEEKRKLSYINEIGIEQLECQIKEVEEELKQSLLLRGSLENVTLDAQLTTKVNQFNQLTDQLMINRLSGVIFTERELVDSVESSTNILAIHQEQAAVLQGIISEHAVHLDGLEEFLKDPDSFKEQAQHIKDDILTTLVQVEVLDTQLNQYPVFKDPENSFTGLDEVVTVFTSYLDRVTACSELTLTGNTYKGYLTKQEQLGTEIRGLESDLVDMKHKLDHYNNATVLECPDCTHQFKFGISPDEISKLKAAYEITCDRVERLIKQQEDVAKKIDNDADWYQSMNQLFSFIRQNDHVKILPELIKEFEVGKVASSRLHNALESFMSRLNLLAHRDTLSKEEALLDARIALLDRNNVLDMALYVANIENELVDENNKITFYKTQVERFARTLKTIQTYSSDIKRLDVLRHEILHGLENQGKVTLRVSVDQRISELTTDKENYLTSIIKSKSLTAVVQSISTDIKRLKRRLEIIEIHMNGLCPNKGLIGKLMTDFITAICGNMNAIINQIWNTPLYIKPCSKDNGDLTYKFPVVKGEKRPTPDVSDCSGGETDILDWVFRLVMLDYIKFPFPLIMDEVGPFLDEIKRGRLFNFIQEYTQSKEARQLFLVSHFSHQQGIFREPNIIALKYEGLTLPGEVNQSSLVIS